jgi:hypothetical protein
MSVTGQISAYFHGPEGTNPILYKAMSISTSSASDAMNQIRSYFADSPPTVVYYPDLRVTCQKDDPSREGFFTDRWPQANSRENFSPDTPGACAANAGKRKSALIEARALDVLSGL